MGCDCATAVRMKSSRARFRSGVTPRSIRSSVMPCMPAITITVRTRALAGVRPSLGFGEQAHEHLAPLLVDLGDRPPDLAVSTTDTAARSK